MVVCVYKNHNILLYITRKIIKITIGVSFYSLLMHWYYIVLKARMFTKVRHFLSINLTKVALMSSDRRILHIFIYFMNIALFITIDEITNTTWNHTYKILSLKLLVVRQMTCETHFNNTTNFSVCSLLKPNSGECGIF
jgi:hypothetical protein